MVLLNTGLTVVNDYCHKNHHYCCYSFKPQATRDYVVGQIMLACTEIIQIVQVRDDLNQNVEEPGYMTAKVKKITCSSATSARLMTRTVQLLRHEAYNCPITSA